MEGYGEGIFTGRILPATDGAEEGNMTVRTAVDLVKNTGSGLHLVYVEKAYVPPHYQRPRRYETEEEVKRAEQAVLDQQVSRVKSLGAVAVGAHRERRWPDQDPGERVVALAEEIKDDLVVTRSRGFGGMERAILGSISDSVVRYAHYPVLVVCR